MALFFLLFVGGIIIYIDLLDKITNDKSLARLTPTSFYEYRSCRILIQIFNPILSKEICCLMFVGFVIAVWTQIGAIQGYEILPWYMYDMFVIGSILTMMIINFTLPFGTESHELTKAVVHKWRYDVRKSEPIHIKHVKKILQSLRPISVNCGMFFKLKRQTKSTFFNAIFSRSCDMNITLDLKELFKIE